MLEELDNRDACQRVRACVEQVLDAREKQIIMGRYGMDGGPPGTQRELAQRSSMGRFLYSRIEKRALQKLGEAMERGGSANQRG